MKHKQVVFNGKYMVKKECRGVQRYTREVLHALDSFVPPDTVKVLIPANSTISEHFKNIEIVPYGGKITTLFWQNLAYQWYLLIHRVVSVCLSDGVPFWGNGIYAVHDVRFLEDYRRYTSYGKKIRGLYGRIAAWMGIHNSRKVITVSEFSRQEILKHYRIPEQKVIVCHNAWQHFNHVTADESIFEQYQQIKKNDYYFLLGGKEDNKNMYWVMKMALKYPGRMFVLTGPSGIFGIDEGIDLEKLNNCLHLGYLPDGQVKALMMYCKAFLFPSKYEGFGIPPMEAMSVGAKVIMSNATCLPEIYQQYVSYFDPMDYEVDLDELSVEAHEDSTRLLSQYSWDMTARKIWNIINELR